MTRPLYMVLKVNFVGVVPTVRIAHVHSDRDMLLSLCIKAQTECYKGAHTTISEMMGKERILAELRQQEYSRQMYIGNYSTSNPLYFVHEVPAEINDACHPLA